MLAIMRMGIMLALHERPLRPRQIMQKLIHGWQQFVWHWFAGFEGMYRHSAITENQ